MLVGLLTGVDEYDRAADAFFNIDSEDLVHMVFADHEGGL